MAGSSSRQIGSLTLQTAPQIAAQALREAIISGELKEGDRILELDWSQRLHIGQPTLREALRELEHQGLLRKEPQRGTYVTQLSPEDYQRILEVRIPLEAVAIGKAAANLTPESAKKLTKLVGLMSNCVKGGEVGEFHDADVLFHRTIWQLAGNEYLSELLETITFRLFVFSVAGRWPGKASSAGERSAAIRQHSRILDGIRTGNPRRAQETFVKSTVDYWNERYGLRLNENELLGRGTLKPSRTKPSAARAVKKKSKAK